MGTACSLTRKLIASFVSRLEGIPTQLLSIYQDSESTCGNTDWALEISVAVQHRLWRSAGLKAV